MGTVRKPSYYANSIIGYDEKTEVAHEGVGSNGIVWFDKRWSLKHIKEECDFLLSRNTVFEKGYVIFQALDEDRPYTHRRVIEIKINGLPKNITDHYKMSS